MQTFGVPAMTGRGAWGIQLGSAVKSVGSQGIRIQLPIPTCWFTTVYNQYLGIDAFPGHLRPQADMWYTDMHAKYTYTSNK